MFFLTMNALDNCHSCICLDLLQGTAIFEVKVRDGDTGIPRKLDLSIIGDTENFFELDEHGQSEDGILSASLRKTSGNTLDRELLVSAVQWWKISIGGLMFGYA